MADTGTDMGVADLNTGGWAMLDLVVADLAEEGMGAGLAAAMAEEAATAEAATAKRADSF